MTLAELQEKIVTHQRELAILYITDVLINVFKKPRKVFTERNESAILNRRELITLDKLECDNIKMQYILGKLSVGIELLMKAFLNQKSFALAMEKLDSDSKIAIFTDNCSSEHYNRTVKSIMDSGFESINFQQTYSMCEQFDIILDKSAFSTLRDLRNKVVHNYLGEKDANSYKDVFCRVFETIFSIEEKNSWCVIPSAFEAAVKLLVADINKQNDNNIFYRIREAYNRTNNPDTSVILPEDENALMLRCPICGGMGKIEGEMDKEMQVIFYDYEELVDVFIPSQFECIQCGITAQNSYECKVIGLNDVITMDRINNNDKRNFQNRHRVFK